MADSEPRPSQTDPQGDSELTPEALGIIQRARRSFGFSIAILLLGFVAIVGALVYRAIRDDDAAATRYDLAQISVPAGADVRSVSVDGDALVVTYAMGTEVQIRFINIEDGALLGEIAVAQD